MRIDFSVSVEKCGHKFLLQQDVQPSHFGANVQITSALHHKDGKYSVYLPSLFHTGQIRSYLINPVYKAYAVIEV